MPQGRLFVAIAAGSPSMDPIPAPTIGIKHNGSTTSSAAM